MRNQITYHIGSADWSFTINTKEGPIKLDLAKMDKHERGKTFATMRDVLRGFYGGDTEQPLRRHKSRRRHRGGRRAPQ